MWCVCGAVVWFVGLILVCGLLGLVVLLLLVYFWMFGVCGWWVIVAIRYLFG